MKHRKVLIIALALMLMGLALIISPGCTSTLEAVTGTYSYYEVTDGKVTYFRRNPMSMRYHTRVLEEADPDTFEAIDSEHGKDATTVYQWDVPILHADPATFERLGDGWSRDAGDFYSGSKRLEVCNINTFEPLSMWRAVDSQCCYVKSKRLENVDRESLEILGGVFAKHRTHIYWLQHIDDGADPATFEVKEDRMQSLARDATQCFIGPRFVTCDELTPRGHEYCRC